MSRRKKEYKRYIKPDEKYNSLLISKFINKIMLNGKKSIAKNIVYKSLERLSEKVNENPLEAFKKVIENASPLMEVKSRRVGGSTYQVPVEVKEKRATALAMRWLINFSRAKKGADMIQKLSTEFIDVYNKVGSVIKKREDTHKMAESNKAFAHFRW